MKKVGSARETPTRNQLSLGCPRAGVARLRSWLSCMIRMEDHRLHSGTGIDSQEAIRYSGDRSRQEVEHLLGHHADILDITPVYRKR